MWRGALGEGLGKMCREERGAGGKWVKEEKTRETPLVVQWMTPGSQCRGPRLDPWSGNQVPHAAPET